jgi:hypothetical protein
MLISKPWSSITSLPVNSSALHCPYAFMQVEEFMLWDMQKVASVISSSTEYKPNCCLVIIDFLVRHGLLAPEEGGYLSLVRQLRAGDPL